MKIETWKISNEKNIELLLTLDQKNEFWKFHAWKYPQNTDKEGQSLYDDFQWSVIKDNVITAHFPMMTGVKQGCCMTGFLFLLDFAEDIDLLSLTIDP